ncbi:MAG: heparan-alpha-glucosaminide N-acetyltransferase domain-containing protein [Micrococcus sp.]|nr:heparan-alpha-glucosaminide N-acetyltransferase domain-containing protein [Micrococcus sp.]
MSDIASGRTAGIVPVSKKRLIGIDAARGLALIGLMAVHILPLSSEDTGDPTWTFTLFYGDSAALFALLAGVGLALTSGGRQPHSGRQVSADRAGLAVRAAMIGVLALVLAAIIQPADPETSILLYYSMFFLLAIPFLSLGPRALFVSAAAFLVIAPILMQQLGPMLPEWSESNPGVVEVFTEPAAVVSQLLLTGTYPALPYMTFLLAGLGLGRLNLRSVRVQAIIAGVGAALAVLANLVSSLLFYAFGGYQALLDTPDMTIETLDEAIVYGPELVPADSGWWYALATPHTNMPLALVSSLGTAMMVLGVFLLVSDRAGRWLRPLAAMGAMTLTLYSAHLAALAMELHYDDPELWFVIHVGLAGLFAWFWQRSRGRGPLEAMVSRAVNGIRIAAGGSGQVAIGTTVGVVQGGNVAGTADGATADPTGGTTGGPTGRPSQRPPASSTDG